MRVCIGEAYMRTCNWMRACMLYAFPSGGLASPRARVCEFAGLCAGASPCLHVCISVCLRMRVSATLHVCMRVCLHVCMSACLQVRRIYTCACVSACPHEDVCISAVMAYMHAYKCMHSCGYAFRHARLYASVDMRTEGVWMQ